MDTRAYRHEAAQHTAAAEARREAAMRAHGRNEPAKARTHEAEANRHERAAADCLNKAEWLGRATRAAHADGLNNRRTA